AGGRQGTGRQGGGRSMITRNRAISAQLTALLLAGPLTPLAHAQQPTQPPGPDLFQETLKAERESDRQRGTYDAGAVAVNVFLVPGRGPHRPQTRGGGRRGGGSGD